MIWILPLVVLLALLLASLGVTVSPLFFLVLAAVLLVAAGGYGFRGRNL